MAFTSVCENTVNRRLDRREQTSDGLTNRRTCFESHLSFSVSIPAYRSNALMCYELIAFIFKAIASDFKAGISIRWMSEVSRMCSGIV